MQACDSRHLQRVLVSLSLLSRLVVCVLVVSSSALLSPFDSSPRLVLSADVTPWTASLLRWDVFHFGLVASHGPVYEHEWAFLPAISLVMSWSGSVLASLGFSRPGWPALLCGGTLVAMLFDSTRVLYQLSLFHLRSPSAAFLATALSLISSSPAALRFAPYSEPFFTYFSYRGMLASVQSKWLLAALYFAAASAFRSNGLLLSGFIVWGMLVSPLLSARWDLASTFATLTVSHAECGSNSFRQNDCYIALHWSFCQLHRLSFITTAVTCCSVRRYNLILRGVTRRFRRYIRMCKPSIGTSVSCVIGRFPTFRTFY